jgi:hypothetical protein
LILWFNLLNKFFGVKGEARISLKLRGRDAMEGISSKQAVDELKIGLNDSNKAFIYHCYNHYMCPIGYEETP